jgi:hypothetical protein
MRGEPSLCDRCRGVTMPGVFSRLGVAAICAAVLAAGCSGGAISSRVQQESARPAQTTGSSPPASTSSSSFLALWPETDRSDVPATLPTWRGSASSTVAHFAAAVLGWSAATVRPIHSRFRMAAGVHAFAVSRRAGSHIVEIHAARVGAGGWSVTYLWGFGRTEPRASVSVASTSANVALDYWNGAASAELSLTYGRNRVQRLSRKRAHWVVALTFPIGVNGAVLVLFRDNSGSVYTGWGTPLPAGPMAAG